MTVRFTALVALAVLALAVAPARGDVFVQVASYSSGTNCTGQVQALAIRPFPGVNCSLSNITEIVGRCISDTMASCLPSGSYAYPTGTSGTFAQGTVSAGTACNASGVIALQSIRDGSCADVSALTGGAVPVWGRASCASSPGSISVFLDRNCSQTFNLTVALDGTCKAPLNGTVGVSLLGACTKIGGAGKSVVGMGVMAAVAVASLVLML